MANLSRVNFLSQMRLDLSQMLAQDSFTAFDFRALSTLFTGSTAAYVIRGFELSATSGLEIFVSSSDSLVFNPQDSSGSFYLGLQGAADTQIPLAASQTFFVELVFTNSTQSPVNQAYWNPLALSADSTAGNEFGATTNSQNVLTMSIPAPNTTGFTPGAVPLYKVTTSGTGISAVEDCRPLLFRLGTGGSVPDPSHKFNWSANRAEPVHTGTTVGQNTGSPFLSQDTSGVLNDKGLHSFKDWMDAVMTRIAEIAGTTVWYSNGGASNYVANLSLNNVFFDSPGGHSINPSAVTTLKWNLAYYLESQGSSPVEWQSNYAGIKWRLGNTFTSSSLRSYSDTKFVSPTPTDGGNLYLTLQRDFALSINPVTWSPTSGLPTCFTGDSASLVLGSAGTFTGVAIGDYIRKASEGISGYYRVAAFTSGSSNPSVTTDQAVADGTVTALLMARPISGTTDTEPYLYFRSNYSSADMVADTNSVNVAAGIFQYQDLNNYWLGRRVGSNFILRNFGGLEPGQEIQVLGDAEFEAGFGAGGGAPDLIIDHAFDSAFAAVAGYALSTGSGTLLTLHRRKRNNEVSTPSSGDNSGSILTYTMASPGSPLTFNVGDSLWAKLSDTTSGALSSGTVVNAGEDSTNVDTTDNVYQVLSAANSPLKNFNNKDVVRIATCIAASVLLFTDGSVLNPYGRYINNKLEVVGDTKLDADLYLPTKTTNSVLWVGASGKVSEDNANFFFNEGTSQLGLFNYRFGVNTLEAATPADINWFSTLGAHTLTIGATNTTIRLIGDVILEGNAFAEAESVIVVDDKNFIVGAGNGLNAGSGSGFSVADNTLQASSATSTSGQGYVNVTYSSAHGYTVGNTVWASCTDTVGGITAGELNVAYTVVASSPVAGNATIVSTTVLRLYTAGLATSTATVTFSPPTHSLRSFTAPSYIQMSANDGTLTGMTSWSFNVKNAAQSVQLTPVAGFDIVPTAKSADMAVKRIPYTTADAAGPSGANTTLDFSASLTWDNSALLLAVAGQVNARNVSVTGALSGVIVSDTSLAINNAVLSSGSLGTQYGINVADLTTGGTNYGIYTAMTSGLNKWALYNSGTATSYFNGNVGFGQVTQAYMTSRINLGTTSSTTPADGALFGADSNLYRSAAGMLKTDTSLELGLYEVFNNYSSITTPPTPAAGKVNVFAQNDLIWQIDSAGYKYPLTTPTGNVFDEPLAVVASGASGNNQINIASITPPVSVLLPLDSRNSNATRYYIVGDGSLEVYLNGDVLEKGYDYTEVGTAGTSSTHITLLSTTSIIVGDRLRFRVDANGGVFMVGGGGGGGGSDLNSAYLAGNTITVSPGTPVTLNGTGKLLAVYGDMLVTGVIDPAGMTFSAQSSAPFSSLAGIWFDTSENMIHQTSAGATTNVTSIVNGIANGTTSLGVEKVSLFNGTGATLTRLTPVSIDSSGLLVTSDVSTDSNARSTVGLVDSSIISMVAGNVVISGLMTNIGSTWALGSLLYVSATGGLTSTKPSVGVNGFGSGYDIIKVGVVAADPVVGGQYNLIVRLEVVGQL